MAKRPIKPAVESRGEVKPPRKGEPPLKGEPETLEGLPVLHVMFVLAPHGAVKAEGKARSRRKAEPAADEGSEE